MKPSTLLKLLCTLFVVSQVVGCAPEPAPPVAAPTLASTQVQTQPSPTVTDQPGVVPSATPTQAATVAETPRPTPTWAVDWTAAIESVTSKSGGEWHILVREVGGETLYAQGQDDVIHPASTIKVAIAALFFTALEKQGPLDDLEANLRNRGVDKRTYDQLLRAMLVKSEEGAADSLQVWVQDRQRPEDVLKEWGLEHTKLTPRRSTLNDLALLFEGLYAGKWISPQARAYLLARMAEYSPNDELRLGGIRACQAEGEALYNKRGTLTDEKLIVGDAALIEREGKLYFVGAFAYQLPEGQPQTTYEQLEAGMADFAQVFCSFLGVQQ